jgi:hypothetical protein
MSVRAMAHRKRHSSVSNRRELPNNRVQWKNHEPRNNNRSELRNNNHRALRNSLVVSNSREWRNSRAGLSNLGLVQLSNHVRREPNALRDRRSNSSRVVNG